MIGQKQIEEWRKLCESATEGPWRIGHPTFSCKIHKPPHPGPPHCQYTFADWCESDNDIYVDNVSPGDGQAKATIVAGTWDYNGGGVNRKEDADFFIAARTALPQLLDEIDRLNAILNTKKENT